MGERFALIPDRILIKVLQLYGAVALVALALVPLRFLPAEDAVILFQYSRNLAVHGVIGYIPGGAPVEGATDFAWMVLLAGAMRCGVQPFWFCAFANVAALLGLALVLFRLARLPVTLGRVLVIAGAAALLRQIFAAASGFAVLPDALLIALLTLCVVRRRTDAGGVTALLLCLFRPDGVVIAVPLLCLLIWRAQSRGRAGLRVFLCFVLPGALYFAWRAHYFGELLPLPFLVKTDFHRELGFLVSGSVRASLVPLLFTAAVLMPVFILRQRTNLLLAGCLVAMPTLFYWTVRLDQNVGARFFYYLPTACAVLLARNWPALNRRLALRVGALAWVLLLAAPLYRESLTFRYMQFGAIRWLAEEVHTLPIQGRLLTSEAGFLPFYSSWPAADPWGLNTPEFAHRFFQPKDVARLHPDLIVTHPDFGESCIPQPGWPGAYPDRSWPHLTRNLVLGATGYELWLVQYGSDYYQQRKGWRQLGQGDRECWLLRLDSPLRPQLERLLAKHNAVTPSQATALERARKVDP